MKQDKLLSAFEQFELSRDEKQQITGGKIWINGCRQDGKTSYVDYMGNDGRQWSDAKYSDNDADGWCENMEFDPPPQS
ncbi:MAG TPA: hypothetical protein VEB86_00895 [Chryseosolibacter sp.]|nr:hypothetical protein [Chryseosolibacter sp.]